MAAANNLIGKPNTRPAAILTGADAELKRYMKDLVPWEGHLKEAERLEFYDTAAGKMVQEKFYTIGYGDYGDHVKPGQKQTEAQSRLFLKKNVEDRLPQIRAAIPAFDSLPKRTKSAIVVAWFRTSLRAGHKTTTLINQGKWEEAAAEFLKHKGYLDAKAGTSGKGGIVDRMEWVRDGLLVGGTGGVPSGVQRPGAHPRRSLGHILGE
jgi:GH24 family phage-related lysozyme (muramidase)